jgi:hypothetical protein
MRGGGVIIGLAWTPCMLKNPPPPMLSRDEFVQLAKPAFEVILLGSTP